MSAHNLYYIHILKDKKCCACPLKGIFVPGKMFAILLFRVRRLLSCIILTICSVYLTLNPGQHKIKAGIYMSIAVIPLCWSLCLCAHLKHTWLITFQEPLVWAFHQLQWMPSMRCLMECSNEHATALILDKQKIHSQSVHCVIVKQIAPD